jgi:hypothetical protein
MQLFRYASNSGRAPSPRTRFSSLPRPVREHNLAQHGDANQISWLEAKKDKRFADPQAQFTGTAFKGFHIVVTCRGETYEGCIDPCLDDAIETRQVAHCGRSKKLLGGSQPEPASDFVQGDVVARFHAGQIQLSRSLGIEDFLLTQFR